MQEASNSSSPKALYGSHSPTLKALSPSVNLLDLLSPGTMLRALPGDDLQSSQEPHETGNSFVPIRTPSMDG